jgi:ribulose-phosphate 3-epimerase
MSVVAPTITAENPHIYREQMERVSSFAKRVHIDLMDGKFTKNKSVDISQVWLQEGAINDIHVMFQRPEEILSDLIKLKPNMVIVHPESECDVTTFASSLHLEGIKIGLAIFPETSVEKVSDLLPEVDQLLIFSGNLGYQGDSQANLDLLEKIPQAKSINPHLEIAWDGGVNSQNIAQLASAGVDVLNVGGFIQSTPNTGLAYSTLVELLP